MRRHHFPLFTSRLAASACVAVLLASITLTWFFANARYALRGELAQCRAQARASSHVESESTIPLLPATLPDRTMNWESFDNPEWGITFRHPGSELVALHRGVGDTVLATMHIGSLITLEAIAADGVGGQSPADYERLVFNSFAQNAQPDWGHYAAGHSVEYLGAITLYRFHSNVFDVLQDGSTQDSADAQLLRGVIFPGDINGVDWLVYFRSQDELLAEEVLKTMHVK